MRQSKSLRIDTEILDRARVTAGLPEDAPMGAVVRYALAHLAGVDPTDQLDSTGGRGSFSHRMRQAGQAAA